MNKYLVSFISALLVSLLTVTAQNRTRPASETSVVFMTGPSTLVIADMSKPFKYEKYIYGGDNVGLTNMVYSLGFHQTINYDFAYKISVINGYYGRDDGANLFRSNILGIMARGEYNLLSFMYSDIHNLSIYAGGGFSYSSYIFDYPPFNDQKADLGNVSTPAVNIGLAYKYNLSTRLSLGAEIDMTYFFSDRIDGRPSNENNIAHDASATISFSVYYHIASAIANLKECKCAGY